MVKSANPWLRSLLRAGKQQQRSTARALEILLTPAKPAKSRAAVKKAAKKPAAKKTPAPALPVFSQPLGGALSKPPEAATVQRAALAAPLPAAGKWLAGHYAHAPEAGAGRRLAYWLYVPDGAPKRAGMPLLVMLHGCDQSATLFAQGTRMNHHAGRAGFAVLYPQQSVSAHPRRCWKWYDRATQQGGGDVPALAGLIHKVLADYPIDRSRVYICGMSAGAGMANILALNYPHLFAGLGLHSGPLFGAGHSTTGALGVMRYGSAARVTSAIAEVLEQHAQFPAMPTMLIQGEDDPVVCPVNREQLERQALHLNRVGRGGLVEVLSKPGTVRSHPYELRDMYVADKLLLRVARIAELKHAWSGGDPQLSFNSGAGPDASKMLVDFFARHRRLGKA